MNKELERFVKQFNPDGHDINGPYWILPNDRKTSSYEEWKKADKEYWKKK